MRVLRAGVGGTIDSAAVREAADALRSGALVVFPTETVYGLGAHALDERAVRGIYEAKGRPPINPVIVHVAGVEQAKALAAEWTPAADALANAFWPGPITLVVRKRAIVPDIVTAGRDSVGLRVPAHPVALALLREAAIPVAAPSANPSTHVSPTTADHVARGLGDRVDIILDGGPTTVGIESTVVDVTGAVPRILRPGMISRGDIERIAGNAESIDLHVTRRDTPTQGLVSPGMLARHYAPKARVRLFGSDERGAVTREATDAIASGKRVGALLFAPLNAAGAIETLMPRNPEAYARQLYALLHEMDDAKIDLLLVELPPDTAEWSAIRDRLKRAATP